MGVAPNPGASPHWSLTTTASPPKLTKACQVFSELTLELSSPFRDPSRRIQGSQGSSLPLGLAEKSSWIFKFLLKPNSSLSKN